MSNRMRFHAQNILSLEQSRVDRDQKIIYDVVAMQVETTKKWGLDMLE